MAACGSSAGLSGMISLVQQFTQVVLAGIAIYFFVGLIVNLAQAQLASATGDPSGYAHALQQAVVLVLLLAVAGALPALSATLTTWLTCVDGSADGAIALWRALATLVVAIVLSGIGIATTVAVVWSVVRAQAAHAAGLPGGVAHGLWRTVVLLGGGLLTLSAGQLANSLLALFSKGAPP